MFPPQTECERLREILPGYKAALALGSRHAVDALIRDAFRDAPSTSDVDTSNDVTKAAARLDDAVAAHALLRRRAALLEGMAADTRSCLTTEGVRVAVRSALVPEMSSPAESSFVFSYTVSITNLLNDEPVQVVSRHWRIQDEEGRVYELRLRRAARGSIGDGDDIDASIDPASIGADTPERVDRSLLSTLRAERASERAAYERDLAEVTRLATAARREDASRRPERTTRRRRSPPAAAVRDVAAPRVHRPPVPPSYPPPAPPPPHPPPIHHDTAVAMNWRDTVDAAKAAAFTAKAVAEVAEPPAEVAGAAVNGTPLGTLSD